MPSIPIVAGGEELACFDHQHLFKDGGMFMLKTDWPEEKLELITREQARVWLDEKVICEMIPHEFRRDFRHWSHASNHTSSLRLGELLRRDQIEDLNKLEARGIPVQRQAEGALMAWLAFAERVTEKNANAVEFLKDASGVLTMDPIERVIERERAGFLTASTVKFFLSLVSQAKQMPLQQASEFLEGLSHLIEHHPGLADEYKALDELLCGCLMLGKSEAVKYHLRAA